jgi:hypothetical protein
MTVTSNRPGRTTQADRSIRLSADPRIVLRPKSDRSAPQVDDLLCLNAEEAQFLMAAFARVLEIASDETEDGLTERGLRTSVCDAGGGRRRVPLRRTDR